MIQKHYEKLRKGPSKKGIRQHLKKVHPKRQSKTFFENVIQNYYEKLRKGQYKKGIIKKGF